MGAGRCWLGIVFLLVTVMTLTACHEGGRPDALNIGLAEEPRTTNIWLASDANSRKVLSLIYQPLYMNDPETLGLVPWLAQSMPVYDPNALTYTVTLRSLKWSDGTPFTAADVVFTGWLIQTFKVPRYASKWSFIARVDTPTPHTVVFHLKKPMAAFLSSTLATPIVQEREWAAIAKHAQTTENPLATLLNHRLQHPIGTGPFTLAQWRQGAFLHLKKIHIFSPTGR